jgi:hypothetical protein
MDEDGNYVNVMEPEEESNVRSAYAPPRAPPAPESAL